MNNINTPLVDEANNPPGAVSEVSTYLWKNLLLLIKTTTIFNATMKY